jgi:hypothetical protein
MSSPETATVTKASLAQGWLNALRYWLRGRNGVIALIVLAVVSGAALNWSWLVAVGIAPLLLTVLPCAVMCGLGLCLHKTAGGSCSTETHSVEMPKPGARVVASLDNVGADSTPLLTATSTPPRESAAGAASDARALSQPEERS